MDVARDPELGRFVAAGDLRAAGAWLVEHYARDVISLCRAMVRPKDAADDLAQDTFSAAFAALAGFRQDASARTWLLSIARNRCIDHLRRARRAPFDDWGDEGDADDYQHPGPLHADVMLTREDLSAALEQLDESERALVVLRFRHGLEYPELADVFGVKQGTVRMRLSRALSRMRAALEARDAEVQTLVAAADFGEAEELAATPTVAPARERASLPRAAVAPAPALAPSARAAPAPAPAPQAAPAPAAPPPALGAPPPPPAPGAARPPAAGGAPPPGFAPPPQASRGYGAPPPPAAAPPPARQRAGFFSRLWHWLSSGSDAPASAAAPPAPAPAASAALSFDDEPTGALEAKLSEMAARLPGPR